MVDRRASAREAWKAVRSASGVDAWSIAESLADAFRLDVADLDQAKPTVARFITGELARRHLVFPLREGSRDLVVATCDPTDVDAERAVSFASGRSVRFEVAPPAALEQAIDQVFAPDQILEGLVAGIELSAEDAIDFIEDENVEGPQRDEVDIGPVVKLTNLILRDAIAKGASDVHVQPTDAGGVVRLRVDGVLHNYMKLPAMALVRVVSRIKVIGDLDIADRLRPQDGRARIRMGGSNYDLRISTVPTGGKEKAVIRVLDTGTAPALDTIGFVSYELERLRTLLGLKEGIILVTGPTGSGKTTTLYASLRELAREGVNIMTVEDPVEYELQGVTQIQVNAKQGVTFASALRAILRQDPDIVLVGEIRDQETAEMAVQAAMTGHVVLATLHTNDAPATVRRLLDMGLQVTGVTDALRGAVAQRLLRLVCTSCAVSIREDALDDAETGLADRYGVLPAVRAVGCAECDQTGYRGRTPVAEVMIVDDDVTQAIASGAGAGAIREAARRGGMRRMLDSAIELVKAGRTTLAEVSRVLGEEEVERDGDAGTAAGAVESAVPGGSDGAGGAAEAGAPAAAVASSAPAGEPAGRATTPGDEIPAAGAPKVLVVDDDATTRMVVRGLLQKLGFTVREVGDGTEAVQLLKSDPIWDLVVLDLDMPLLEGRDVLRVLRSYVPTTTLPILVLTGTPDADAETEVLELGADDYVRKPIEAAQLTGRVKALMRRAGVYSGKG
jgi:type II secretory ATPase GspE/PulE/Tfp pilus assembly ATPase PilB-like protein/ActR/RegA family two-component response regulator